jgi:O-antigen/teichoic acid export membrane protein
LYQERVTVDIARAAETSVGLSRPGTPARTPPDRDTVAEDASRVPLSVVTAPSEEVGTAPEPRPPRQRGLVLRNTLWLVLAQIVGTPLSLAVNAAMARYLGAGDFGYLYLATTYTGFGFLAVEWGQGFAVPALIARARERAGELLGSALVWRAGAAVVVYGVLAVMSAALGYDREFRAILPLAVLAAAVGTFVGVCQTAVQGLERSDLIALGSMGQQLLIAAFVIPTLVLGGRLSGVFLANAASAMVLLFFVARGARKAGIGRLAVRLSTLKELVVEGYPFLFMGLAMALQPVVDAVFMSRLASHEAVGWYAAARKLVGLLIFPVAALTSALYPTLCRLFPTDIEEFRKTAGGAVRAAIILVIPVAICSAVYADLGISVFSKHSFGPAEDDLRVFAPFTFLVYFTMVLGTALAAAGKQRAWTVAQSACVAVSVVIDPLIIPYCEKRYGNGGLGVCAAAVFSETLMLLAALWLMPRGVVDRKMGRTFALCAISGASLVVTARLLSGLSPFLAAPLAVSAYGVTLWLLGGIDREQVQTFRQILASKAAKR